MNRRWKHARYLLLGREAQDLDAFGVTVPIASLRDIVRSKEAAGREKDIRHLPVLYQSLRELERREGG